MGKKDNKFIADLEKKISELQNQLSLAKKSGSIYLGQYVVDKEEEIYMKVDDVEINRDKETVLIGSTVCLNEKDFYVCENDELCLSWGWTNIEICTKQEYEKAVEEFATKLKEFL